MSVAVYHLREGNVVPVRRTVETTPAVARAALEALLDGPTADERAGGLASAIPAGTTLLDISLADAVATVDLSGTFDDGGGSASMLGRVAQVVATLTRFPTIDRVAFRLDGEPVETIGGEGVAVNPPLGRRDIEDETPQVLVESPLPGDTVSSPIRLRGTANVFEATVSLEVRDAADEVILETFTTATSGTGTRGTFGTELALPDAKGPLTIVAFESSAEDGRPLHVVRVRSRRPLIAARRGARPAGRLSRCRPKPRRRRPRRGRGTGASARRRGSGDRRRGAGRRKPASPRRRRRRHDTDHDGVALDAARRDPAGPRGPRLQDATVTLIQFEDLQCPVCKSYQEVGFPGIVEEYVRPGQGEAALRRARVPRPGLGEGAPPCARRRRAGEAVAVRRRPVRESGRGELGLGHRRAARAASPASSASTGRSSAPTPTARPCLQQANSMAAEAEQREVPGTPWFFVQVGDGEPYEVRPSSFAIEEFRQILDDALAG